MIQEFELWAAPRTNIHDLQDLADRVVAIEADFYLDRLLNHSPAKEPLLAALGGTPFSFRSHVENDLAILQDVPIKPIFIFSGLDVGKAYAPFAHNDAVANANAEAWDLYNRHEATEAVANFGTSGYATPRRYYRLLQEVLREQKIEFQVAPYSALGQLAYLARSGHDHIDAIAGSSELLLYDIDRVITSFDLGNSQFTSVIKQDCVQELEIMHPEMFTDACMLSGCSLLPSLPSLPPARKPRIRQVVDILRANGNTGNNVYSMIEKDQRNLETDYLNRYKCSRLAVKHDTILTAEGRIEPMAVDQVPNDLHDIIGQRLPDELYYYLSVGAVGARILNQLTSARIYENCPADGGDSLVYQTLVSETLTPMRAVTLALLAFRLHRAYHHRMIELSTWYTPGHYTKIDINEQGDPNEPIKDWRILGTALPKGNGDFAGSNASLDAALKTVSDASFATNSKENKTLLQSTAEVKANALIRFLYFRGYVDAKRTVSPWGKILQTIVNNVSSPRTKSTGTSDRAQPEHVEAAVLATELLKLNLLTSDNLFPRYTGAPMYGSEEDKANTLLLARVACLGKLRHKSIGFTGPLSRHLLAYTCLVDAVRTNLRDQVEISLTSMLLAGHASKERNDLTDIALDMPFLQPLDCALGIAVKHYLDDVHSAAAGSGSAITPQMREQAKERGPKDLFPHVQNFREDLESVWHLWDAVYAGALVACDNKLLSRNDKSTWTAVNEWVKVRR